MLRRVGVSWTRLDFVATVSRALDLLEERVLKPRARQRAGLYIVPIRHMLRARSPLLARPPQEARSVVYCSNLLPVV